jgi:hypothetical protein
MKSLFEGLTGEEVGELAKLAGVDLQRDSTQESNEKLQAYFDTLESQLKLTEEA